MRPIKTVIYAILILMLSSCVISVPEHKIIATYHAADLSSICKLKRLDAYELPELPSFEDIEDSPISDILILDRLIDHISLLRSDLSELKLDECDNI